MKHLIFKLITLGAAILLCLSAVACHSADTDVSGPPVPTVTESGTAHPTADGDTRPVSDTTVNYAPDFTVLDKDGNPVKLSDFRGKPVVLNFWATWCPPCKQELPDFNHAAETYKDDVVFLMVNLTDGQRETVDVVKAFVADNGYTFPVYFDTAQSAANAYRIASIPTTYFINAQGEAVRYQVGMMSATELESGIQSILP